MLPSKAASKRKGASKDECPTKKSMGLSFTALLGEDDSTPQWWMVNLSFKLFRPDYPRLCLLLHSWVHPSSSSCYEAYFPFWMSFLLTLLSSYWPSYPILPHYGFLWSFDVLLHSNSLSSAIIPRSGIQRLSLVLHSGKPFLPSWLLGLELVVQLVRHPSHATRLSFVT